MAPAPPDGFTEFVATRSPALLRSAWLLTGDAGKAEDLLQTALASLWPKWERVALGGNPEAYVRRMLYTTYLSWRRRLWRFETPTEQLPDRGAGPLSDDLAHGIVHDIAGRDAVRRALAKLSRQQRAIVVLRYVEDRSVEETADLLGCSTGTVKVQSARALAHLRDNPHLKFDPAEGRPPRHG